VIRDVTKMSATIVILEKQRANLCHTKDYGTTELKILRKYAYNFT